MGRITALLRQLVIRLSNSIKRFPEAVVLAVIAVGLRIVANHWSLPKETEEVISRIIMILALSFPVALSLNLLGERYPQNRKLKSITFSCAVVMLLLYFTFWLKKIEYVTVSRYTGYTFAFYLAFLFIPYLFKKEEDTFGLYVIQLFIKFCVTYLYSLTLYLGLALILFTINRLFNVKISSKLYFDFWLIIAGIFAPVYFLAELPEPSPDYAEDQRDDYPNVLKILFLYFLIPIISVYTVILYAYFAKIIITRTWPSGLVAHLVLWYAFFSTLLIFFISPLRSENRIAGSFAKLFPRFVLPLLVMMFVAIGKRIEAFGITENRYYVLVAGLWLTVWMLYSCFVKQPRHIFLPLSLSIIMILAVTGPWNSFTVAKFSQNKRFVGLLNQYELLEKDQIIPRSDLPEGVKREICELLFYFNKNHSLQEMKLLPKDFELKDTERIFGFAYSRRYRSDREDSPEYIRYLVEDDRFILPIDGYEILADINATSSREISNQKGVYRISYFNQDKRLTITKNEKKLYDKNILELVTGTLEGLDPEAKLPQEPVLLVDENEDLSVCYVFKRILAYKDRTTGELKINHLEFYLLIKD